MLCYSATIEFQKRGLPHIHIVITLDSEDAPRTPEDVDKISCAEIPDKVTCPDLYKVIVTNNIHGPCGSVNRSAPCMIGEGKQSDMFIHSRCNNWNCFRIPEKVLQKFSKRATIKHCSVGPQLPYLSPKSSCRWRCIICQKSWHCI